jgi:MFS family permease
VNDFKKLMTARFFFTLGTAMQAVVIGWQMYALTHDPLHLGLIGLAEALPALTLALFAGYVVDRSRPLFIYRWVLMGSLVSGLVLFFSQQPALQLSVHGQVLGLFFASVITGVARGFSQPALYAAVPRIIPREHFAKASAWMVSALQIARIAGPAVGGLVFGWFGIVASAFLVCGSLGLALLSLALVKASPGAPLGSEKRALNRTEILSGASFVFKHPILFPALSLDMISVLFGGVTALLPIYAADILKVGSSGLGVLRAAPALGAALTSIWLTRFDIQKTAGSWLFSSVTGFGICILVFGVSHDYVLSLFALALGGAFDSISMVIRGSAVQLSSPDSMRGRISAVNSIFIGSSNELGEFESGVAAKLMGTVPSVILGGVICLATVLTVGIVAPSLRKLDLTQLKSGV